MGAVYGSLGLIVVPVALLSFVGSMFADGSQGTPGFAMLLLAVLAPVLYGTIGFVLGAFTAWIYNLSAGWIGGVRLELKAESRDLGDHWTFPDATRDN